MRYGDDLARALGRVGIGGGLRRRIVAEIADHLASDPSAPLGPADALARRFADELGTSRSRRAAFAAFAALALAGVAFTVAFVALAAARDLPRLHARMPLLGELAAGLTILAPQLAFVAGVLAALRAYRRRHDDALSAAEAALLHRRTALALVAGLAAMCGLALLVFEYEASLPAWLTTLGYACAAAGGAAVAAAAPATLAAVRVRVSAAGEADDVFADLGPLVPAGLRGRPWPFARAVAVLVFLAVTAAGVAQADPFDGALRGLVEAAAVLGGFALLGRYLGLRRE